MPVVVSLAGGTQSYDILIEGCVFYLRKTTGGVNAWEVRKISC
jgi:hypothetical protein